MADSWKLYYWPGFPGRGELVRLMLEELGLSYEDVGVTKGAQEVLKLMRGEHGGWPVRAPPIVQNGDFYLSQTHAILEYLGKKYGAWPKGGIEEEARASQINMMLQDLLEEACTAYHPLERSGTYESQKEAAVPFIAKFRKERIPKYKFENRS
jgi:glutathione S-transferase